MRLGTLLTVAARAVSPCTIEPLLLHSHRAVLAQRRIEVASGRWWKVCTDVQFFGDDCSETLLYEL